MSLIKPRDGNATSGASLPRNFGVEVLQVLALKKKKRGSWSGPLELIRIYMVIRVRKTGCYVDFTVM